MYFSPAEIDLAIEDHVQRVVLDDSFVMVLLGFDSVEFFLDLFLTAFENLNLLL